ncbi:DUF485 domain-containing protein [Streptomyces sp. NPDC046985]|uniref:DUF485 domain-containing protein n=1 Tax=Streptomyces sp. NPDC046985 TaxID=3155377 RepID=UPI0033F56646
MSYDSSEFPFDRPPPEPHSPVNPSAHVPSWSTGQEPSDSEPTGRRSAPHRTLHLLRRAYRWQRRVASFTALGYFAAFLTLTVKAPSLMTRPGPGGLPTGLLLALTQLPVTWLAVLLYEATARRFVDPLARRARRQSYPARPHRKGAS